MREYSRIRKKNRRAKSARARRARESSQTKATSIRFSQKPNNESQMGSTMELDNVTEMELQPSTSTSSMPIQEKSIEDAELESENSLQGLDSTSSSDEDEWEADYYMER
uniref:Uncharacterized protein n=1 Tax=Photinus pyralis TaxID=7054 RepID=A0A1Y1JYT5_PHOPY